VATKYIKAYNLAAKTPTPRKERPFSTWVSKRPLRAKKVKEKIEMPVSLKKGN
jgi:hypothetical protein